MEAGIKQGIYILFKFANNCKKYTLKKQKHINFEESSLYLYLKLKARDGEMMVAINKVTIENESKNVIMQYYIPEVYKKMAYQHLLFCLLFEKNIFFKKIFGENHFISPQTAISSFVSLFLKIKNIIF